VKAKQSISMTMVSAIGTNYSDVIEDNVTVTTTTTESPLLTFRDCWLLFGNVDDVGWTHAHNSARKAINKYLREKYTNVVFESFATPNTFFMSEKEREDLIKEYIQNLRCDYIWSSSGPILNGNDIKYANEFTNISWSTFPNTDTVNFDEDGTKPLNLVEFWARWLKPGFITGAVAASLLLDDDGTPSCAGFINAFEAASPWEHVTGFALGYHWYMKKQNVTRNGGGAVHVVTMNSYYSPETEVVAAQQLIEKMGCRLIVTHTDPNTVDQYVYGLRNKNNADNMKVMSMSKYIDMSLFVGDTVVTSLVFDLFESASPDIESAFLSKLAAHERKNKNHHLSIDNTYDNNTTTTTTNNNNKTEYLTGAMYDLKYYNVVDDGDGNSNSNSDGEKQPPTRSSAIVEVELDMNLSPITSFVDEKKAESVAREAKEYLMDHNPLCGLKWKLNRESVVMDDMIPNFASVEECMLRTNYSTPEEIVSYVDFAPNDDKVIYYDTPFLDGVILCDPGTYYEYNDTDLSLSCVQCPMNTYSDKTNGRIGSSCVPCTNGTESATEIGSTFCTPSLDQDLNLLGSGIHYYGYLLTILISILLIGFAVTVFVYRKRRVIRVSQPLFLLLICFGTFLMGLSIIPLFIDDSIASQELCNAACISFPWLLVLGFSSSFAALFSKIWRINQIFSAAKSMKKITVRAKDVMIPFTGLMSLNIVLLLCWTLLSPPQYERVVISEVESYGTCWYTWTKESIGFVAILLIVNGSAVILANVQAYRARFLSDEFSESRYIALIMVVFLQVIVLAIPLLFLVVENPTAFYFLFSTLILIISTSLLLLIFVPKLKQMKKNKNTVTRRSSSRNSFGSSKYRSSMSFQADDDNRGSSAVNQLLSPASMRITNTTVMTIALEQERDELKDQLKEAKELLKSHDLNLDVKECAEDCIASNQMDP